MLKTLLKLFRIPKIYDKDANLTSNVAVNKLLSPIYLALMFCYLYFIRGIPMFTPGHIFIGSFFLSIFSTLFYVWCSYFFQPDLDVRVNRPGMNSFPFGAIMQNTRLGFVIAPVTIAVSKIWYWFWQPYAEFCTHRGVSHWPIISVWYRTGYILLNLGIIKMLMGFAHVPTPYTLSLVEYWLKGFFPFSQSFGSITWILFCLPVFVSDLAHEAIDALDSKRKGISFCPPQIPRGKFAQLREFVKLMMKKN